jgi:hypothetical protein
MPFRWYGWPGLEIPQHDEDLIKLMAAEYNVLPIFLESGLANRYYNGFASRFPLLLPACLETNPLSNATPLYPMLTLTAYVQILLCGLYFITSYMKLAVLTRLPGKLTLKLTFSSPK